MSTLKKVGRTLFVLLPMVLVFSIGSQSQIAGAKTVQASVSVKQLSVGKQLSIHSKTDRVSYQSSDSTIASVSGEGVVTGKSAGKVTITVRRSGYQSKKIALTVKQGKRTPSMEVAFDEIRLQSVRMKKTGDHQYQYSAVVCNNAKQGKVIRIEYYYQIQVQELVVETSTGQAHTSTQAASNAISASDKTTNWVSRNRTVVLTAKNLKAQQKSSRVYCQGDASGKVSAMHLSKVKLYTGEAVYTYYASQKKGKLSWSNVDLTGPVITGWVGKKSVYQGEPLWLCYADMKNKYHFQDHVKAIDARDGKVPISVDTSRINWDKEGIYKVYYTAKDKSGNQTKAWAKVQVCKPGAAEQIADIILKAKIKSGSDVEKLRRIYQYVQGNCSYTGSGSHTDWRATAAKGIRNHSGDCFTYYAVAKLLITRSGIPHIMVRRYPERPGHNHWWNLVYVQGGWYHFDTTPRSRKGYFCLQTDEQLHMYSTGSTFRFREELYPKRAKKKISRNPI